MDFFLKIYFIHSQIRLTILIMIIVSTVSRYLIEQKWETAKFIYDTVKLGKMEKICKIYLKMCLDVYN